jgi:hypothetical protein
LADILCSATTAFGKIPLFAKKTRSKWYMCMRPSRAEELDQLKFSTPHFVLDE